MFSVFKFKEFDLYQDGASLKVGTDAMVLGSFCKNPMAKLGLDVGTGTGVLSLMVAQTHPNLTIDAVEIDYHNCTLAKLNVEKSIFSTQINVLQEDIFTFSPTQKYDFIFSNPPFHIQSLKSDEQRYANAKHFSDYEFALFIQKLSSLLTNNGKLFMILPSENLVEFQKHLNFNSLYLNEIIHVYGKPNRKKREIVICSKVMTELKEMDFLIRESNGNYSNEYIELTKPFHGIALG